MTDTKIIQESLCKYLAERGHESLCENYGHTIAEMDVASLSKSGMLHEFEIKISRADFIADKSKRKWSYYESKFEFHLPNYFNYVCPENLIAPSEIPVYAGLYYYNNGEIRMIKAAKRTHNTPKDREKILGKMLRINIQRKYLGGCMLTVLNRRIRERNLARDLQSLTPSPENPGGEK